MRNAQKRGSGEMILVLDELENCVSGSDSVEGEMERRELAELLNSFWGHWQTQSAGYFFAGIGIWIRFRLLRSSLAFHRVRSHLCCIEREGS